MSKFKSAFFLAALVATVVGSPASRAAVVDTTTSVQYSFLNNAAAALNINQIEYGCSASTCTDASLSFANGATANVTIGSTLGGNEYGDYVLTNSTGSDSTGLAGPISPSFSLGVGDTAYVTLAYGSDAFGIDSLVIRQSIDPTQGITETVTLPGTFEGTVSAVPLPASLPLFFSGLIGLGAIARRRNRNSKI